jgi:hypothetical protein
MIRKSGLPVFRIDHANQKSQERFRFYRDGSSLGASKKQPAARCLLLHPAADPTTERVRRQNIVDRKAVFLALCFDLDQIFHLALKFSAFPHYGTFIVEPWHSKAVSPLEGADSPSVGNLGG